MRISLSLSLVFAVHMKYMIRTSQANTPIKKITMSISLAISRSHAYSRLLTMLMIHTMDADCLRKYSSVLVLITKVSISLPAVQITLIGFPR